jgi:Guanylate-binding protein, N-terminal domain
MVVRKNGIRKELTNFFKERDCFMLIRPVDDEKKLQNMSLVKDS